MPNANSTVDTELDVLTKILEQLDRLSTTSCQLRVVNYLNSRFVAQWNYEREFASNGNDEQTPQDTRVVML